MTQQTINIGTVANDGTGDLLRTAFDKTNDNFDELYADIELAANLPTIRPSLLLDFANSQQVDPRVTFARNSTATYFDRNGVMQTASANVPRINFDPVTGECKGLLIEEARTNLVFPSAIGESQIRTVTAVAHTLSFCGTGSVALSGVATGELVGTGVANRVTLTFTPTAGALTLGVTGSITNMQLEAGSFPSSYIPTTTGTVGRLADVASMTGANFSEWYRQDEGSFCVEFLYGDDLVSNHVISFNDGTSANEIAILGANSGGTGPYFQVVASSAAQAGITDGLAVANTNYKAAAAYKLNDFAYTRDGRAVGTDVSGTIPTVLSRLDFGSRIASAQINGHIARIAYYPARLTNTQLQALTS